MLLTKIKKLEHAESVHYFSKNKTIYTKFDRVYIRIDQKLIEIKIPIKLWKKILGNFRIFRRLFRIDQYTIKVVNKENDLVIINDGNVYHFNNKTKILTKTLKLRQCNQLLKNSICITPNNDIFFGEYGQNKKRKSVPIYKSSNGGKNWVVIYEIPAKKIRHIHGCFWDNFNEKLWILTGDFENENHFINTDINFKKIEWIGDGTQKFRACNLFFTTENLYWITDSELEQNYLFKLDRNTKKLTKLQKFPGPAWYAKKIDSQNYIVSITCEKGPGSHPIYGYIFHSNNLENWSEVFKLKKDYLPKKYFKNGVVSFSDGKQQIDSFEISGEGFMGLDGKSFLCKIESFNSFLLDYIQKNIFDLEALTKKNISEEKTFNKFKDVTINDLANLIRKTKLNDIEYNLNESILRYCEIKNKNPMIIANKFNGKDHLELLLSLFLINYLKLNDIRYLNIVLKLLDSINKKAFSKSENKRHFKYLAERLLPC
jgi:hypothetical protein